MTKTWLTIKDLKVINSVFSKYPSITQAIIFWSRAMWNYKRWSDIDIALKWEKIDYNTISKVHWRLEEETPLPYFFDVLDYKSISKKELVEHIDKYWKIIYSKK